MYLLKISKRLRGLSAVSITFTAFVAAVALVSSVLSESSFAAGTNSTMPVATEVASEKRALALSAEQFAKIKKRLDAFGKSGPLNSKLTRALGATEENEQMVIREVSFERDGFQHGFLQSLRYGDDRIILLFRTPEKSWMAFLTNTHFELISAATWDAGELPKPLTREEASDAFANELLYWATLSEIL